MPLKEEFWYFRRIPLVVIKNMLKAWSFTKTKFHYYYFGINLQKIFQANILKSRNRQVLLIVALKFGFCLNN